MAYYTVAHLLQGGQLNGQGQSPLNIRWVAAAATAAAVAAATAAAALSLMVTLKSGGGQCVQSWGVLL